MMRMWTLSRIGSPFRLGGALKPDRRSLNRHREAASAGVAIHNAIGVLSLDCFASLAMTAAPIERTML
jgi:hypothetical protein